MAKLDPNGPAQLLNRDVDTLFRMLADLVGNTKRIADALERAAGASSSGGAIEVDIDAGDGDPPVPFKPKAWTGDFTKNAPMSSCPADFLDVLAGALEAMAAAPKEGKEKFAHGNRVLAAKARAWAKRKRAAEPTTASGDEDDLDKVG